MTIDDLYKQLGSDDELARINALRQLCADFKSGAAPFFFGDTMIDPSPLVRETCAQLLGDNPALASLREAPLWLTGFAADSGAPNVRATAMKSLGKVDPDLRFPPARAVVFQAALVERDPVTKATARNVLDSALRRDLASQDSDRQWIALKLLRRLDEPTALLLKEVLVVAYNQSSTDGLPFAAFDAVAFSRPPLIPKAVLRTPAPPAARKSQRLFTEMLDRLQEDELQKLEALLDSYEAITTTDGEDEAVVNFFVDEGIGVRQSSLRLWDHHWTRALAGKIPDPQERGAKLLSLLERGGRIIHRGAALARAYADSSGHEVAGLAQLEEQSNKFPLWVEECRARWEMLDRPHKPLRSERITESQAAYERGEGEPVSDVIARLEQGGPLVKE